MVSDVTLVYQWCTSQRYFLLGTRRLWREKILSALSIRVWANRLKDERALGAGAKKNQGERELQ